VSRSEEQECQKNKTEKDLNIVNDQDLKEAALKFQDYQERKSPSVGTITPKQGEVIQFRHAENE